MYNKPVLAYLLCFDSSIFKQPMKNIVQNRSERVSHVLNHLKLSTSLAVDTYGIEHAKAHFRLLL